LTVRGFTGRRERSAAAPQVGLFGLLGSGNIGNDVSMESVLRYLRADHPDAIVDAMCKGPDTVRERYGVAAIPMNWYQKYEQQTSGVTAVALKTLGKGVDAVRTARWVRRHDVVIVPGMGVLEASLPLQPWGMPYAMFLLSASGRLFGTKIALVSVGANVINKRLTRYCSTQRPGSPSTGPIVTLGHVKRCGNEVWMSRGTAFIPTSRSASRRRPTTPATRRPWASA
jgi:hypothetical protein